MATIDFFLKMDGIPGESKDVKHKGEIDLESFSWAEANPSGPSASGGGRGAGKVQMQDFHFVTRVNKASPLLFLACATGKHIKEAILTARKAGKGPLDYLVIKFKDVLVSSYQISGSEGDAAPMDQVSFNFGRIDIEYREQKPDGSLASPVRAGWDVLQGKQT